MHDTKRSSVAVAIYACTVDKTRLLARTVLSKPHYFAYGRNNMLPLHLSRRSRQLRQTPAEHSRPFLSHVVPAAFQRRKCPHQGTARSAEEFGRLPRRTCTTKVRR